ncbi:alpha-amylase family glycosyl hydrolase [Cellulomonas endometrii]|uniref:alpha-amylase family glycosyl hydrolase n=1 Tax=Cellulomonas endometrii TaxID=3036301 RepID=UPI0024AE69B7|nr:alpha-amylase family glycosyl hydrolase [Cellulomonas endometrii]
MTDHDDHGVHLLAYTERLGGDLAGVRALLREGPLSAFSGVHLLPFFVPFDGDDAGFDPVDHGTVDPRLGSWDDVRSLAADGVHVTADLIVNHVSASSAEFADWLARGAASPSDGMFLTFDTVFPDGGREADITAFYRPRTGLPFTPYQQADGTRRLVWTTFMPTQVDLDVHHPAAVAYLRRTLRTLREGGVSTVRLDAVGYAVKTPGTDSFMTPHTLEFVERITALAHEEGLRVLVEVHAHHSQQAAIAPLVDLVYDFALPPLLLHGLATGESARLRHWLDIRPANAITVLDTHDGIGVIDAGPSGDRPGLLSSEDMAAVFAEAERRTGGESALASAKVAWAALPHQINATFFSVLGEDPTAYLLARCVQLFVPGRPQIYYVGLLAGTNDMARFARSGQGRDVNRHHYTAEELATALAGEVTRAQLGLVGLRTEHPAFRGDFTATEPAAGRLQLAWHDAAGAAAVLTVDLTPGAQGFAIEVTGGVEGDQRYASVADLAALADQHADASRA